MGYLVGLEGFHCTGIYCISVMQEKTRMFDYGQDLTLDDVSKDEDRKLTFLEWIATMFLKPHV